MFELTIRHFGKLFMVEIYEDVTNAITAPKFRRDIRSSGGTWYAGRYTPQVRYSCIRFVYRYHVFFFGIRKKENN
jgi:hypothetical protein